MSTYRYTSRSHQEWEDMIKMARSSGQMISRWCKDRGICTRQFYYWEKKLREEKELLKADNPFYELTSVQKEEPKTGSNPAFSGTVLQYGDFNILITDTTTENTISAVIRGIQNA